MVVVGKVDVDHGPEALQESSRAQLPGVFRISRCQGRLKERSKELGLNK